MKRKIQNTIFFIQFVFTKLCILDLPRKGMNKKGGGMRKLTFLTEKYCTMGLYKLIRGKYF